MVVTLFGLVLYLLKFEESERKALLWIPKYPRNRIKLSSALRAIRGDGRSEVYKATT